MCSFFLALSLKRMWLKGCSEEKGAVEEKPLSNNLFCSLIFLILLLYFLCDLIAEASSKIAETIPEIETSCTSEPLQEWSALVLALFFFCHFFSTWFYSLKYGKSRIREQIFISGTIEPFQVFFYPEHLCYLTDQTFLK